MMLDIILSLVQWADKSYILLQIYVFIITYFYLDTDS